MVAVSILLPIHNGARFLEACLDSIFAQTYKNYNLVVVNDHSTDDTEEILREYGIKSIKAHKTGEANARNEALKHAKGKYLVFMDCDDIMSENRLELSLKYIKDCDVVYSGYQTIDDDYNQLFDYKPPKFNTINFVRNQVIPHSTMMIRKDKMIPYRDYKFSCDFALIKDLVVSGCKFKEVPEPLIAYRMSRYSMTGTTDQEDKYKYKNIILKELKDESIWFNS